MNRRRSFPYSAGCTSEMPFVSRSPFTYSKDHGLQWGHLRRCTVWPGRAPARVIENGDHPSLMRGEGFRPSVRLGTAPGSADR